MTRWLAILVLVATAGTAHARIKITVRSPGELCRGFPTWGEVTTCLKTHGTPTIERQLPRAKLVRVVATTEHADELDNALYLYVQSEGQWAYAGFVASPPRTTVLGLEAHKIATHTGYRITVGQLIHMKERIAGAVEIPVIVAIQETVFCAGTGTYCAAAVTHCDVMYRGKTMWTFRGTLVVIDDAVVTVGDRSRGGTTCTPVQRVILDWPVS